MTMTELQHRLQEPEVTPVQSAIGLAAYLEAPTPGQIKLGRYLHLKAEIKRLEEEAKTINEELKVDIGEDGERITLGDQEATVTRETRHRIDPKLARNILSDDYLEAITVSSVSVVLRVNKIKEEAL